MDLAVQANAMQSKSINMTSLAKSFQNTGLVQNMLTSLTLNWVEEYFVVTKVAEKRRKK